MQWAPWRPYVDSPAQEARAGRDAGRRCRRSTSSSLVSLLLLAVEATSTSHRTCVRVRVCTRVGACVSMCVSGQRQLVRQLRHPAPLNKGRQSVYSLRAALPCQLPPQLAPPTHTHSHTHTPTHTLPHTHPYQTPFTASRPHSPTLTRMSLLALLVVGVSGFGVFFRNRDDPSNVASACAKPALNGLLAFEGDSPVAARPE